MVEKGVSPDVVTYSSLIQGFSLPSLHAFNISGQELGKQVLLEHHAMRRFYDPMIELEKTDLGTLVNSQLMCSECLQGQFLL
ncbi:hypothetical protein AAC387_Pa08g2608 [Persea americana]